MQIYLQLLKSLLFVFIEQTFGYWIRQKGLKNFLGGIFLNLFGSIPLNFKPGFLQERGPHVHHFDWLREQRPAISAQNIVVDEYVLPFPVDQHLKGVNSVSIGLVHYYLSY